MKIVGIHTGHNATACLFADGRIEAIVSEERFSRNKNDSGFPGRAVQWLFDNYSLDANAIDRIAIAGLLTGMEIGEWEEGPWEIFAAQVSRIVPARLMTSNALVAPYLRLRAGGKQRLEGAAERLSRFRVPQDKIDLVEHHSCHAHAAYWLDPGRRPEPTLVVTLDNTGDGRCGTIHVADGEGGFTRLHEMQSLRSLGMMYTAVTRYLGMKAVEDEYKVMGMAPYAKPERAEAVYRILRGHMDLTPDELDFANLTGLGESAYVKRFRSELAKFRFDAVCAGVQMLVEDLVLRYLKAWSRKTGIRKLVVGGGVFMNVKMNMLINESPDFDDVFFLPSCGDESNAAGAALESAWQIHREAGERFDPAPLGPLYLGPEFSNEDCEAALRGNDGRLRWEKSPDLEAETAKALAEGRIVGRMRGRMEFGARSLGNRSIMARADSLNTVHRINRAIKMRDFWMPFAPSVLAARQSDYVINPKGSPAHYMILGFRSTPLAVEELIAGLHPFDRTCRPQLVEPEWNPHYHHLLEVYESLTGSGGILNTSFNLHGEPVVCTPEDAISTYLRSDLDLLTLEDYLVWDPKRIDRDAGSRSGVASSQTESAAMAEETGNAVA
ncbi:MAG: carbamoyltransferase C-terminal domain-containing protein [Gammaproteobacteria bacterium]|nr:carbamoyltransferase C-terminal domain-containing protein [Gammaproteobacteria bacterium]